MQHEITERNPLLDEKGHITEAGWARDLVLDYNRENINSPLENIKEWDYYYTGDDDYGLGISMANMGKIRALSVHFMDYKNKAYYMNMSSIPLEEKESHQMPLDTENDAVFESEDASCRYTRSADKHRIELHFKNFLGEKDLKADIDLTVPETESMVIVVPFDEDPTLFYYNQKINNLHPEGTLKVGEDSHHFSSDDAYSVVDWGRGVWPPSSTWYWGSASGRVDGVDFGFNIGYGFGNTSAASENLLIYDGKVHKLEDIKFHIPEQSFTDPWTFTSSDGRFEMDFQPILDRHSSSARGKYHSSQHQVFGKFTGKAILDDGTEIKISDFMGFAEEVANTVL